MRKKTATEKIKARKGEEKIGREKESGEENKEGLR